MLYLRRTFGVDYQLRDAEVALIGVPFDSTTTGKQSRYAPMFIRNAIASAEGFDPESKFNVFSLKFFEADVDVVHGSWWLTKERVEDTVRSIFEENENIFPIFLGGEHLITLAILNAISGVLKKKVDVIQFDAHLDMKREMNGCMYSHATFAYHLLKMKRFNLFHVGARSFSEEEVKNARRFKVRFNSFPTGKNPIYITFDIDAFDASIACDASTPEPQGMTYGDVLRYLKRVDFKMLVGMDIVECAPDKINSPCALAATWLIKKVLGRKFQRFNSR